MEAAEMGDPDAQYDLGCSLRSEVRFPFELKLSTCSLLYLVKLFYGVSYDEIKQTSRHKWSKLYYKVYLIPLLNQ